MEETMDYIDYSFILVFTRTNRSRMDYLYYSSVHVFTRDNRLLLGPIDWERWKIRWIRKAILPLVFVSPKWMDATIFTITKLHSSKLKFHCPPLLHPQLNHIPSSLLGLCGVPEEYKLQEGYTNKVGNIVFVGDAPQMGAMNNEQWEVIFPCWMIASLMVGWLWQSSIKAKSCYKSHPLSLFFK